jgi:hypothetical protein
MTYLQRLTRRHAPQTAPIPGTNQSRNSAGGFVWAVDEWTRPRRFLILGSEGGSYYAGEWNLTRENAKGVEQCLAANGPRTVAEIVAVSELGRAPRNDPALVALAMAAGRGDLATRRNALEALPRVARTSTHLFQFATFVDGFRGWGRSLRRAVGGCYARRSAEALAYQAVKYRRREGMTHRDVLRLAHPAGRVGAGNPTLELSDEHRRLFEWMVAAVPGLTPRDASAALALVTAATETRYETVGLFAGRRGWKTGSQRFRGDDDGITPLAISPRQRLDDAVRKVSDLPFGSTDVALPMPDALAYDREVDVFVTLTDNETWADDIHPAQALAEYRRASGIDARLVTVAMVSNGFSIADPHDPGQLDVVGFETATPQLISDFARGAL